MDAAEKSADASIHKSDKIHWIFPVLLALTLALTVEEGIHLYDHPQGWPPDNLTALHHPGCIAEAIDRRIFRCPVDGYNSALFICSDISCRFKEPVNGTHMTPYEERIWNIYMRRRTKQEMLEIRKRMQNGTLDDAYLKSESQKR